MPSKLRFRSALSTMQPYIPGEQPQGGKFIKLNTNENPYPCSTKVIESIGAATAGLRRYPDPMANSFRRAAAESLGLPSHEYVLAGNGSDEILTLLVRAFVGEGQLLRLPYPSYILYRTLAEIQGARWQQIPFDEGWRLPSALADFDDTLRLVFVPNPNSPSGTVASPDEILRLADSLPCPLVVDEAYADFAEDNCLRLVERNDNIIVTRTLSKSHALAGLRFGFCIAQPHVIAELTKIKDSYNCDALSIAGAAAAISDTEWLAKNRAAIVTTRSQMSDRLKELGFRVTPSQGNFVWCSHPDKCAEELFLGLKENQILVRYMRFADWGDGLRITVGTDEQMDACMTVLQRLLSQ